MNNKVKVSANAVLTIIQGIFNDDEVNTVIDDPSAPREWKGKRIQDILNVEYFTFKHRPLSSEEIIAEKLREGREANTLEALDRGFCVVSLGGVERLFSKDVDMATVTASMEYWVQTDKIQLLEYLIEDSNLAANGIRIPVVFGEETRQAVIIFSPLNVVDVQTESSCGEMAVCEVTVNLLLYPDVASYSDYTVKFEWMQEDGQKSADVPLTSFSAINTMTQKAVPYVAAPRKVGNINLSCANSFVLVFDGYNNDFINYITDKALSGAGDTDNNQAYTMTITRREATYVHEVVIKDHQIIANDDTGNETHTLCVVTRGQE